MSTPDNDFADVLAREVAGRHASLPTSLTIHSNGCSYTILAAEILVPGMLDVLSARAKQLHSAFHGCVAEPDARKAAAIAEEAQAKWPALDGSPSEAFLNLSAHHTGIVETYLALCAARKELDRVYNWRSSQTDRISENRTKALSEFDEQLVFVRKAVEAVARQWSITLPTPAKTA